MIKEIDIWVPRILPIPRFKLALEIRHRAAWIKPYKCGCWSRPLYSCQSSKQQTTDQLHFSPLPPCSVAGRVFPLGIFPSLWRRDQGQTLLRKSRTGYDTLTRAVPGRQQIASQTARIDRLGRSVFPLPLPFPPHVSLLWFAWMW